MMGSISKRVGLVALSASLAGGLLGCTPRSAPASAQQQSPLVAAGPTQSSAALGTPASPAATRQFTAEQAGEFLRSAAREGDLEIVSGLLKAGATVDAPDESGYTPLILAAYHGYLPIVEALLAYHADACHGDRNGNTALMGAAFKGYEDIVERLSREPCTVQQTNGAGRTALMFATLVGKSGISRLLTSRGADPNARDATGKTAEDWAKTQGVDLRLGPTAAPAASK